MGTQGVGKSTEYRKKENKEIKKHKKRRVRNLIKKVKIIYKEQKDKRMKSRIQGKRKKD